MQPNNEPAGNWGYRPEGGQQPEDPAFASPEPAPGLIDPTPPPQQESVTWTASEFLSHEKNIGWYLAVIFGGVLVDAVIYLVTRDLMSTAVIFIAVLFFAGISATKPRQLTYTIDPRGIAIGSKFYSFDSFKSFAIMKDGAIGSINLVPLKRFMPELTIYYAPTDEARILDVLINSLPNDQKGERATDRVMKHIRF